MPVNAMLLVNQLGRMPKQGTDGRECFYRHASSCKRCHGGTLKGLSKADSAMPRLRPAGRVVAQYQANAFESRKEDRSIAAVEVNVPAEWQARCGVPVDLYSLVIDFHRQSGNAATADVFSADPGAWTEMWWRFNLRELGAAACELAEDYRCYRDPLPAKTAEEKEEIRLRILQTNPMDPLVRKLEDDLWGGVSAVQRAKSLSQYLNSALLCRPHGFSSIGRLPPDTGMRRLLLHGLHVFLATACDERATLQLHERHTEAGAINGPHLEMYHYLTTYSTGTLPTTFTGMMPPIAAQVPLFDHLSLHWQLYFVQNVVAGLMPPGCNCPADAEEACSHYQQPLDFVYNWAAFNKLLLLGMYAPVEEAHAPQDQTQLVLQQLDDVAAARAAEAASACSDMQQALSQFRCVLHEQLQAELCVGQATLQLFAWQQQQQNEQQPPEIMLKLQQQLQSCQLSDLWAQNSSSSSGGGSGGGGSSTELQEDQQSQQLLLLVCTLLAWPLVVMSDVIQDINSQTAAAQQQRQQQQRQDGAAPASQDGQQKQQHAGLPHLQELLYVVADGLNPDSKRHNNAVGGVRGFLQSLHALGTSKQPQQPTNHQHAQQQTLPPQQQLMAWLLRLLTPASAARPAAAEASAAAAAAEGDAGGGAAASSSSAAEGAAIGVTDADPVTGVKLHAFTRGACSVLLVRLLAQAPPCDQWPWEVCLAVLQLLTSVEQAVSAAGAVTATNMAVGLCWENLISPRNGAEQQQQQEQGQDQQQGPPEGVECGAGDCEEPSASLNGAVQTALFAYVQQLLETLQAYRQAEDALQALQGSSRHTATTSATSSSSSRDPRLRHKQRQSGAAARHGAATDGSSSRSRSRGRLHQQQLLRDEASSPIWWRGQVLQLYRETRPNGFAWLQRLFTDIDVNNNKPGFWALVGRFASADQLNLQHMEDAGAVAAAPRTVLIGPAQESKPHMDTLTEPIMISKQLARIANLQLLTKGLPSWQLRDSSSTCPIQPFALRSLMESACLAVQQPQLLSYATAKPAALQAAAAKAAAARAPTPDVDGDIFHSPAASPEPASSHARNNSSSSSSGAAGAAGAPRSSSAGAAAAAAAAAAEAWRERFPGFHLSMLAGLGPLFEAEQQGPCLVRFMQLLLQYRTDCATAAAALQQRLSPELQRRRLWVPPGASNSSSSSSSGGRGGKDCSSDSCVAPDRSRLLVLLMGLYHLQMLSEQRYQQQLQQLHDLQEQHGEQQHGSPQPQLKEQQQQQQQQPLRQRSRHLHSAASSAQTAAAAGTSLYEDLQQRCKYAAEAANAAYSMGDLLLYCIGIGDPQAAGILPGNAASAGSSSSSGRSPGGSSPVKRFVVCGLSRALVRDGLLIQAQHGQYHKGTLRVQAPCDFCGSRESLDVFTMGPLGALRRPAAGQYACATCGERSVFCDVCWNSSSVRARHGRCCRAGGALQQAHLDALAEVNLAANGQLWEVKDDSNTTLEDPCTCNVCNTVVETFAVRSLISWINMPLSQLHGPWDFLDQSCLLPVAGFCQTPQHIKQLQQAAAGRLDQHNGLHNAYMTPLQALFVAFEQHVARHKTAAAAANASSNNGSSSHGSKAGSSSNVPYGSQQRHPAHSGAAAADAFGRNNPKSKGPEGVGGSSGLHREARQQQQQQGQPASMDWQQHFTRVAQHFAMPAGMWGAGTQPGPALDRDEAADGPQDIEEALQALANAASPSGTRFEELD